MSDFIMQGFENFEVHGKLGENCPVLLLRHNNLLWEVKENEYF